MSASPASWVQRQGPSPVVCAASAFNALGLDAHQTWAFWRAQLTPFTESPFICPNGERATMALCRVLSPRLSGDARVIELASRALRQLVPLLSPLPASLRCAFGLALPARIASEPQRGRRVLDAVSAPLAERWPGLAPRALPGRAGFARLLVEALSALESRTLDIALLGGADSAYDAGEVQALLDAGLLFDTEDPETRIPGEAAAFLLLCRPELVSSAGLEIWGAVEGASTHPQLGPALAALTRPLKARRAQVDWVIGDVNNEPERVGAWTLAFPRAFSPGGLDSAGQDWAPTAADGLRADYPAECFGDLGAAMLPTAAVLALESGRRGDPPASRVLLGCCDSALSGGALLNVDQRSRAR